MAKVTIEGVVYPKSLQTELIARVVGPEFPAFIGKYNASKKPMIKKATAPTDVQNQMAAMRKAGKTIKEIATAFNITKISQVNHAIARVSEWAYMHS